MKTLVCFALLLPMTVGAQTKSDHQRVMAKFQRFYNAGRGDSIQAMFQPAVQLAIPDDPMWTREHNASLLKRFGTLRSFSFIGVDKTDPSNVYVFRTYFSKAGAKTTSLTVDENSRVGTFRFMTTSEGIDDLLKKRKAGR